jgi:hypothetical protein
MNCYVTVDIVKKIPISFISLRRLFFLSLVSVVTFTIISFGVFGYLITGTPLGLFYLLYDRHLQNIYMPSSEGFGFDNIPKKPVIYLYPPQKQETSVYITYQPGFSVTYPEYRDGWQVTAFPDGHLSDKTDGREYSYLYWEGNHDPGAKYDMTNGFVVSKEDTKDFLQKQLSSMGLIPREYNEFIVYWLPQLQKNSYNLIHFATLSEYADRVSMTIDPTPDSLLRVFMVFSPIEKSITVIPQYFPPFERKGFTVIEWGGSEL